MADLTDEVAKVNKIMSNATRRKILDLINQNGSMSYSVLRESLNQMNTGQLNYHLKCLGNLISKDEESGKYILTEFGLAVLNFNVDRLKKGQLKSDEITPLITSNRGDRNITPFVGVVLPLSILSVMTYYLFFYLDVSNGSAIISNIIMWLIVLFLILRGYFLDSKGWKSAQLTGKGVK